MNWSYHHYLRSIASLSTVLAILILGTEYQTTTMAYKPEMNSTWKASVGSSQAFNRIEEMHYDKIQYRIAQRLQKRLRSQGNRASPSIDDLALAVLRRQSLLTRHTVVHFATADNPDEAAWSVSAQRYPLWISPMISLTEAAFVLNQPEIARTFEREDVLHVDPPHDAILRSVQWSTNSKTASRVEIEGIAKPGYLPDSNAIASAIVDALDSGETSTTVSLQQHQGSIINVSGEDLGDLQHWATGRSNYKGSPTARKYNVQYALNDHVNNTIVASEQVYSFNSTLDGPVNQGNGWRMAKVIFNGGDLELAPGGGICQASTTLFRAAVLAGLPIIERRAHSLYVTYYKEYGVGIDATIFPGSQDLTFRNDSGKPLIVQAYNIGDDAFVSIYGSPDGRTVSLDGPYFASTAPDGYLYNGRTLSSREIVWQQNVVYPDGTDRSYQIGSLYKSLPASLAREFEPQTTVHAAAQVARAGEDQ